MPATHWESLIKMVKEDESLPASLSEVKTPDMLIEILTSAKRGNFALTDVEADALKNDINALMELESKINPDPPHFWIYKNIGSS